MREGDAAHITALLQRKDLLSTPSTVEVCEGDLNALLQSVTRPPLHGLTVWIEPDRFWVETHLSLCGERTIVIQSAASGPEDHDVVDVLSVWLDDRRLSRFAAWTVERAVNDALADSEIPLYLRGINLSKGVIIIELGP